MELTAIHPFESAGLGKAPFRFRGVSRNVYQACPGAPIQGGGTCDYCGNGIMYEFTVSDSNGKVFKVGCDCINRLWSVGKKKCADPMREEIRQAELKMKRDIRHEREASKIASFAAELESMSDAMEAIPHSKEWAAKNGQTMLDEYHWWMANAGTSGKLYWLKMALEKLTSSNFK